MRLTDIVDAIQDARTSRRSLWLWGPPGIGKTSIVDQAHRLLGITLCGDAFVADPSWFTLVTLRVCECEPVDFGGFPTPDESGDRVKRLLEQWVPRIGTMGILFLDELAQATVETQCAAMRLVDHLPDGWQVVAASNRVTDRAGARQSPTHVLERFTHLNVDVDREGWQRWAMANGIHPFVRGFIDMRPGLLMPEFDAAKVQAERTSCNPRSWQAMSNITYHVRESVRDEMYCGTVGTGAGAEYIGYTRIASELPHPDEILASPESTAIPKDPSALFAICAALSDRAKSMTSAQLPALMAYLVRLPLEFGALLMIDTLSVQPTALQVPAAQKWINTHRDIFASARR